MQSYFCGDRAAEDLLFDIAERPRHEASKPSDPRRSMGVADDDARAKDCQPAKSDRAQSVFLHAHDAHVAKPAMGCASHRRQQAKLCDTGVTAAACKGADDTDLEPFQLFFTPAHRSGAHPYAAHRADGTLNQRFARERGSDLGKVTRTGIENDISHPWPRRNGFSR